MKLTTAIATLSLIALASSNPITSPTLGDGTVNVVRRDTKNPTFELVDESSHFSIGKRAVPIEHLNDPAVGKAVDDDDYAYARKLWTRADEDHGGELIRRLASGELTRRFAGGESVRRLALRTGVQQYDKVNCLGFTLLVVSCALIAARNYLNDRYGARKIETSLARQ
jgi:hypothetical protein